MDCTNQVTETGSGLKFKLKAGEAIHIDFDADSSFRCEVTEDDSSPLICTSGQPSVAALRLLDLLTGEGTQLFYSEETSDKHLGLGLAVSRVLCQKHGGTIELSNRPPHGACVKASITIKQ